MAKATLQALLGADGVTTHTSGETTQLGVDLAAELPRGSVLSLEGPLGAGKTQLACGLAAALGCEASSPSFAIVHEYADGQMPVFHFDFYRLESAEELGPVGYDDCLGEGLVIIEWGDKFPEMLPPGTVRLRFELLLDGGRRIRGAVQP